MSQKCKKTDCKAWSTKDGHCFFHSPELAEIRRLANQKGGLAGKNPKDRILANLEPVELNKIRDVADLLSETINLVRLGLMDLKVASCLGNLSNYLLKAIEQNDLEKRLEEIEIKILEKR